MTAEIVQLDAAAARSLTDKIKVAVEGVWHLIEQAYTTRAWAALGYESWDDYCTREFGTSRLRLPREERQEVVASLRESGLSTRAIASGVGVAESTVRNDLSGAQDRAPETITGRDGKTYQPKAKVTETTKTEYTVDTDTGEILDEPTPEPAPPRQTYTRIDVVREVNKALYHAGQAAQAAEHIRREHLRQRNEEAAVWVGRLSTPLAELQRLHDALQEASA